MQVANNDRWRRKTVRGDDALYASILEYDWKSVSSRSCSTNALATISEVVPSSSHEMRVSYARHRSRPTRMGVLEFVPTLLFRLFNWRVLVDRR